MKVQTESRTVRTVCFSPEKHETFKRSFEASSPVKLSKFQLKPNHQTNEEEIIVNKRTKLDNPFDHEITFDITTKELDFTTTTTVSDAKKVKPGTAITVLGRLTLQGGEEDVDVRGKKLKKQESILTDESGSIRLVLWENDIQKVVSGETYMLERSVVCEFDNQPYITVNKETQISKVSQTIANPDDDLANTYKESTISCPPEGILATHRCLSCKKCANLMVEHAVGKTIKCSSCGLLQLSHLCEKKIKVTAFFISENGQKLSLLLKPRILQALLDIHEGNTNSNLALLDEITDDEVQEILLTVEAKITYNNRNIATNVEKNESIIILSKLMEYDCKVLCTNIKMCCKVFFYSYSFKLLYSKIAATRTVMVIVPLVYLDTVHSNSLVVSLPAQTIETIGMYTDTRSPPFSLTFIIKTL